MKEQITTWLFLLLLGSGYNIESVQGQNIINEFPYELSPESYSKWTLEEGYDWIVTSSMGKPVYGFGGGESYTYAISPLFDFSSLNQPEITFTGGYFTKRGMPPIQIYKNSPWSSFGKRSDCR